VPRSRPCRGERSRVDPGDHRRDPGRSAPRRPPRDGRNPRAFFPLKKGRFPSGDLLASRGRAVNPRLVCLRNPLVNPTLLS
jgi:hypothetical protein